MKAFKYFFLVLVLPLLAFTTAHKYYVSLTEVNYVTEKHSVQIISRIFIDDLEMVLRQRYDKSITLAGKNELKMVDLYMEKYLKEKMQIKINGEVVKLHFIGKEYDNDTVNCFIEIENVADIKLFEMENHVLYDLYKEQQNVVRLHINKTNKSFILTDQNDNAVLNFN